MPYRAPELFEIASDATLDERVDVFVRSGGRGGECLLTKEGLD